MGGGEDSDRTLANSSIFDKSALPILLVSAILTIVLGAQLFPLPVFDTDLSAFTPETPAEEAQSQLARQRAHAVRLSRPAAGDGQSQPG